MKRTQSEREETKDKYYSSTLSLNMTCVTYMNIFDVPQGAVSSKSRMMNDVGIINPGNLLARYPHLPQHLWFKSPYFEKKKKICVRFLQKLESTQVVSDLLFHLLKMATSESYKAVWNCFFNGVS